MSFVCRNKNRNYKCALKWRKRTNAFALNVLDYIDASALEGREPSDSSPKEDFAAKLTAT